MEGDTLEKFKSIISDRITEAHRAFRNIDFSVDMDGDEGDEVQGGIILDMAYAYNDRTNKTIENLRHALDKIESGEYGICEECEEEIGIKRLEAIPDAKYCIKCTEEFEKENKQNLRARYI